MYVKKNTALLSHHVGRYTPKPNQHPFSYQDLTYNEVVKLRALVLEI